LRVFHQSANGAIAADAEAVKAARMTSLYRGRCVTTDIAASAMDWIGSVGCGLHTARRLLQVHAAVV